MAVLNHLSVYNGPVSHQEVSDKLEAQGYDKSTIFRALQDLSQAGLARRMELGDHVWRYEILTAGSDPKHADQGHPHLLCVDCGTITCLSDKDVKLNVSKAVGTVADILLRGHCSDCTVSR